MWFEFWVWRRDLDENLQKAFHRFLEIRGIKPSFTCFLADYVANKDSREYVRWLKGVESFVKRWNWSFFAWENHKSETYRFFNFYFRWTCSHHGPWMMMIQKNRWNDLFLVGSIATCFYFWAFSVVTSSFRFTREKRASSMAQGRQVFCWELELIFVSLPWIIS